ncbi:MAG TPA: hypothetical protein PK388_01730 [Kiritimatiellia bacterium]|nr:hypothetical protein [Kiritimatiellia bacterium]
MRKYLWMALLALAIPLAFTGCSDSDDDGDDSSGGGGSSKFVGTWALTQGGGVSWYLIFNADGSWLISDTADGSARRVYGTYVVDGNVASGPMVNPGTGEGEIIATLDGNVLSLDFVEFWHNPYKHVPYTGTKI